MVIRKTTTNDGKKNQDHAKVLANLANLYKDKGDYDKAEEYYLKAIDIIGNAVGKNHPDYADSFFSLISVYTTKSDYDKAEPLYLKALEIYGSTLGEKDPKYIACLNNYARLNKDKGDYDKAEEYYLKGIDITRNVLGENGLVYADFLNELGFIYILKLNYDKAEQLYLKALEIESKVLGQDNPSYVDSLENLDGLYKLKGDYDKAEQYNLKAIDVQHKIISDRKNNSDYVRGLYKLADLYMDRDYDKAEQLYLKALEILTTTIGNDHPDYVRGLYKLADLYKSHGDFNKAIPILRQSIEIAREIFGNNNLEYAESLQTLGLSLSREMGDNVTAIKLLLEALNIRRKVLGENNLEYAESLEAVGEVFANIGDYDEAEKLFINSSNIKWRILGENHPDFLQTAGNLALLYWRKHDYNQAERIGLMVLHNSSRLLEGKNMNYVSTLNLLSIVYGENGHYDKAEPLLLQALKMSSTLVERSDSTYAALLTNLAVTYAATNRLKESLTSLAAAADIEQKIIRQIFSIGSERQRMAYLEQNRRTIFYVFLSLVHRYYSSSSPAVLMAIDLVLNRKGITLELLALQRDAIISGKYPLLKPLLEELNTVRWHIGTKMLSGQKAEEIKVNASQALARLHEKREKLESELARQIPEKSLEQKVQSADRQAITCSIPQGSVLVELIRFDLFDFHAKVAQGESEWKPSRYLAFILYSKEPEKVQMVDLGEAYSIDKMIRDFLISTTNKCKKPGSSSSPIPKEPRQSTIDKGIELKAMIFDPLKPFLRDCKRLFIAPDGDLSRLSFGALPMEDGRYLIDEYKINYFSTGRDILRYEDMNRMHSGNSMSDKPLVAANPDFDLGYNDNSSEQEILIGEIPEPSSVKPNDLIDSIDNFPPLKETEDEGKKIASMLGVKPLLDRDVLETTLKKCKSPHILHIATHGFFLRKEPDDPAKGNLLEFRTAEPGRGSTINRLSIQRLENPLLRCGLALAGANTWLKGQSPPKEAEDAILTGEDVSGLDLSGTELVVLSACDTGLGDVVRGEGVFGLRRSFVLAGAKTLVMSLWKVPDEQTKDLMIDFYHKMSVGKPRAEALREAQLGMKEKYPNPYYWGAFICQGDPGLLSNRDQISKPT